MSMDCQYYESFLFQVVPEKKIIRHVYYYIGITIYLMLDDHYCCNQKMQSEIEREREEKESQK